MSEICILKDCDLLKDKNTHKCILHCNKNNFEHIKIKRFWNLIREKYIKAYREKKDIKFEKIIFPKFEAYTHGNPYNFLLPWHHSSNMDLNIKFINCTFLEDFNMSSSSSLRKMRFEKCTFYGSIEFARLDYLEIIDSEFKKEITLGNGRWKELFIKNTKFIKEVTFNISEKLIIDNESIYRMKLIVNGLRTLNLTLENSSFMNVYISNTKSIHIKNIISLSTLELKEENELIVFEDFEFNKKVSIHNYNTFECKNVKFNLPIIFSSNNCESIIFKNVHINKLKNIKASSVEIIDESVIGDVSLTEETTSLTIKDSNINSLKLNNINTISIEKVILNDDLKLSGNTDKLYISSSKLYSSLLIDSCNDTELIANEINGDFQIFEGNNKIVIKDLIINRLFKIKGSKEVHIEKVKGNPNVKLITDSNATIVIYSSRFNLLELTKNVSLKLNDIICRDQVFFSDDEFVSIDFINVKCKEYIEFPVLKELNISFCIFSNGVIINNSDSVNISNKTKFKGGFWSKVINNDISINDSFFENTSTFVGVKNKLELINVEFKKDLTLTKSLFSTINIHSSSFNNVDFSESSINVLNITNEYNYSGLLTFNGDVVFKKSEIKKLNLNRCHFKKELVFEDGSMSLDTLDKLKINNLRISNFEISNLFKKSKEISIEKFDLENISIEDSEGSDIKVSSFNISEFNINKLRLLNNFNLIEIESKKLRISNSNIEKIFRIESSNIEVINSISNIFEDIQIIDNKNDDNEKDCELRFKNTTIKNSVFDKLKYKTFNMSDAHVSDAKIGLVKFKEGSRETNRFFKNYYDSISDYVTANSYYRAEMEELYKVTKGIFVKTPLFLNKWISDFGQSWIRPLLWLVLFSIIFFICVEFDSFKQSGYILNHLDLIKNDFARFLNPFSKKASDKYFDVYAIWLTHKLIMSVLIYHFVISIKRQTKR